MCNMYVLTCGGMYICTHKGILKVRQSTVDFRLEVVCCGESWKLSQTGIMIIHIIFHGVLSLHGKVLVVGSCRGDLCEESRSCPRLDKGQFQLAPKGPTTAHSQANK